MTADSPGQPPDAWLLHDQFLAHELPAGETRAVFAEVISLVLQDAADPTCRPGDRRDRISRICQFWKVEEAWLKQWIALFGSYGEHGELLVTWLQAGAEDQPPEAPKPKHRPTCRPARKTASTRRRAPAA